MKKVGLLAISLLSLNFVSAAYGSFTSFSFSRFIDNFNTSLLITALIFLLIFGLFYKAIQKSNIINNRAIEAILSFGMTALAIYGFLQTNIDLTNLFYGFGLPQDFLRTAIPIVVVLVILILIIKLSFGTFLMMLGSLLVAIGFLDLIYSKGLAIALGLFLLIFGAFLKKKKRGAVFGAVKTVGKGLGSAGSWAYRNRPSMRRFLKKESRIIKKIKKLEKKYQKEMSKDEPKKAKEYVDQIEYLKKRLNEIKRNEQIEAQKINRDRAQENAKKQRDDYLKRVGDQQIKDAKTKQLREEKRRQKNEEAFLEERRKKMGL